MNEGTTYNARTEEDAFIKAEYLERFLAKFIDFLVAGALFAIPSFVGPLAGTTYLLISDGLKGGQSLGKRIIGLKTVTLDTGAPCDFRKSLIRNSPFAVLILFCFLVGWIPYLGKVLAAAAALAIFAVEISLIYTDSLGARFGDRIARTVVVPAAAE
jgi:uncharacterized RDD family membrane protein YckC